MGKKCLWLRTKTKANFKLELKMSQRNNCDRGLGGINSMIENCRKFI